MGSYPRSVMRRNKEPSTGGSSRAFSRSAHNILLEFDLIDRALLASYTGTESQLE